jgi:hypothetical protein
MSKVMLRRGWIPRSSDAWASEAGIFKAADADCLDAADERVLREVAVVGVDGIGIGDAGDRHDLSVEPDLRPRTLDAATLVAAVDGRLLDVGKLHCSAFVERCDPKRSRSGEACYQCRSLVLIAANEHLGQYRCGNDNLGLVRSELRQEAIDPFLRVRDHYAVVVLSYHRIGTDEHDGEVGIENDGQR